MADLQNTSNLNKDIKRHLFIYFVLLLFTAINFMISHEHLFGNQTVVGVMGIAFVQGALVLCYFMHLLSEKKFTYLVLILTVFFFIALFFLPILSASGKMYGSYHVH